MAETNLGQVVGIWLEPTEPPHKNVLWIKTINLLTSEKAGFIWNGTEWINIQGQGFEWKGIFDVNTNYQKNDIISFNNSLYIKRTNIINNIDNPVINTDYDLFIPAPENGTDGKSAYQTWLDNGNTGTEQAFLDSFQSASGVEGSVQVKAANGKFFGSNLFTFLSGLLSLVGNFVIKGLSTTVGNALEVRNSNNVELFSVYNSGGAILRNSIGTALFYTFNNRLVTPELYGNSQDNNWIKFDGVSTNILGQGGIRIYSGQGSGVLAATIASTGSSFATSLSSTELRSLTTRAETITTPFTTLPQARYNLTIKGQEAPTTTFLYTPTPVIIQGGLPREDTTGQGHEGAGVYIKDWKKVALGTPVLEDLAIFKNGKIGFYGSVGVEKQSLPANPTNAELATVLSNLGLVNLI